jgi:tRNA A-37 threonylcarbamoyl transferase component Bud32
MLHIVKTPPPLEDIARPGDVLDGRYKLVRVIGEGGMGTVFLAEHVLIKRRVAVKVLHSELARDQDVVERFMNEARAAGTLGHPNIVESTDMGFARNEVPFIVFEYLEGTMLSDEVYRLGGLTARRTLKIANQIASALDAAHRAGIVHRDLKTDNVFLTDKDDALDHVKVLDFGISRFLEAGQDRTGGGKRRGTMMGTPEFMAPEQIMSPDNVDARTDIYAFGVMLYECLAARTPFINENKADPHELLHRIVLDRPPPLATLVRGDLPAGLADMIHDKLLAKEPDARYQSMRDVQAAIEAFASVMRRDSMPKIEPAIEIVSLPPATPLQAARPVRRRPWLWLLPALVAGAAGGVLVMAPPTVTHGAPATAELERDAERIASSIDARANAATLRAEGIASSPVLRAAIETDAATLEDMARDGAVIKPQSGEVIEIFQLRDGHPVSLLRVPRASAAIASVAGSAPHLVTDAGGSTIVVSAPVVRTNGDVGGSIAISVPIDLRTVVPGVGKHAIDVKLTGAGNDIVLADHEGSGVERTFPVPSRLATLSLVAVVGSPLVATQPYALVAYGCLAAAGLFLLLFLVGLVARR